MPTLSELNLCLIVAEHCIHNGIEVDMGLNNVVLEIEDNGITLYPLFADDNSYCCNVDYETFVEVIKELKGGVHD